MFTLGLWKRRTLRSSWTWGSYYFFFPTLESYLRCASACVAQSALMSTMFTLVAYACIADLYQTLLWHLRKCVKYSLLTEDTEDIITTAQLHSTKPELRFCAGSNPARVVSEFPDGEDLWHWSRLEIRLNAFRLSIIPQKQFIIITKTIVLYLWSKLLKNTSEQFLVLVKTGLKLGSFKSFFQEFKPSHRATVLLNTFWAHKYFLPVSVRKHLFWFCE